MKKKKVFIAISHYDLVDHAANYGFNLAKVLDRTAFFYGVEQAPLIVEPTTIVGENATIPNVIALGNVREKAERNLSEVVSEAKKTYNKVEFAVDIGFPESSLIAKTDEEHPYVVILESNNELTTLNEWFGTYETRLAENIEAPVLVLPQKNSWSTINKITYILDSTDHKVDNMRFLSTIAEDLGAELSVIMISPGERNEDVEEYNLTINTLRTLLGYTNVTFHRTFAGETATTVEKLMERTNADWLAFEHKSQSFIERVFGDYNTKRLILQSEIPVLVF